MYPLGLLPSLVRETAMELPCPLLNLLVNAEQKNFTGKALVHSSNNIQWQFYFFLGQLIWVNGGVHPHRSWLRQLVRFASEVNCAELISDSRHYCECSQYQTLYLLFKKQFISKDCLRSILEHRTQEHFFDILQVAQKYEVKYLTQPQSPRNLLNGGFKPDLAIIDFQKLFHASHQYSSLLAQSTFGNISLNSAPKVLDTKQLQAKVDLNTYGNLIHLVSGQSTLRDLSVKLNQDVIQLICSLAPYEQQGILEFQEIPDLANNFTTQEYMTQFLQIVSSKGKFTVACIDDNNQIHQKMEQIVTVAGGRFVAIKDEFQVIPRLIEHSPELIFLKMAMPVVNGYELCAQIKRVPQFNQIPIIMLCDNNSLTQQIRAKLVGISHFIAKSFDQQQVTKIIKELALNSVNSRDWSIKKSYFPSFVRGELLLR